MKIIRVFPRRTTATPDDSLAFTTAPPKDLSVLPEADEIHISTAFTYDIPKAEQLAEAWYKTGIPVRLGGPAFNEPGGVFVPGMYVRHGYVITSRGCPNRCPLCAVPEREGYTLRELPVVSGHNVLDDNLLACSESHIRAVFAMLKSQLKNPIFTGGLEAKRLREWHVSLLREVKTKRLYYAYDTPDDLEYLVHAGKLLRDGGITKASHTARCYVLIGYDGDTLTNAEKRLREAWAAGFFPHAMLYRDETGIVSDDWRKFARLWARPHIVWAMLKKLE